MKLLNLGCGQRYHVDWLNIDFVSCSPHVIGHNLLDGIPYNSGEIDVVYHSHVLEHFLRDDAVKFISECYRVLKPGGIIRIAVPDLEKIVRSYMENLEGALGGNKENALNYEWIMLELYDQVVRNSSGGDMAKYLQKEDLPNEEFIYSRVGQEAKVIRDNYLKRKTSKAEGVSVPHQFFWLKWIDPKRYYRRIIGVIFNKERRMLEQEKRFADIGRFRMGGEVHQWMYDRYSLGKLLSEMGFKHIHVTTAFESKVPGWNAYELESKNGMVYKPDSLFMEAVKS